MSTRGLHLLVGLLSLGMATDAWAQLGRNRERPSLQVSDIVEAPRDQRRVIEEAEKAIRQSKWAEASMALGIALGIEKGNSNSQSNSQDYFIPTPNSTDIESSLRSKARLLIDQLPSEGQKLVELRYGLTAKQQLENAASNSDWARIARVYGDFGFTQAGREAGWLLSEQKLASGDALGAAILLDSLLASSLARDQFGPGLGLLASVCWRIADQSSSSRDRIAKTREYWPKATVRWATKSIDLERSQEQVEAFVNAIPLTEIFSEPSKLEQWLLPGGRADNNGQSDVGSTMRIVRWHQTLHESRQHEVAMMQTIRSRPNESLLPARIPLVVDPWVILQTYDQRVQAIHQQTGKIVWIGQHGGLPVRLGNSRPQQFADPLSADPGAPDYLANHVWGEFASGQLSSDGQRVFEICDISALEAPGNLIAGPVIIPRTPSRSQSNVLRAFSLAEEGKLVWEIGGDNGLGEPKLAGALFLGTPIAAHDRLYAIIETNGEVALVALEPKSGRLLLKQQLAANRAMTIASDLARRSLACRPAVYSDLVVCPTLSGCLVAFDSVTNTLRWAYRYGSKTQPVNNFNTFQMESSFDVYAARPVETSVLLAEGCAVHMPTDASADLLYAVDVVTGKRLWHLPREDGRFLGGVWDKKLLVVGDRRIRAIELKTGKPLWKAPIELGVGEKLAGRGARSLNRYFLPLTNQEIVEIDIDQGKIISRSKVEEYLGNLVATKDSLLSMGPVYLSAYSFRDRLSKEIDLEFLRDPSSPMALARKGEVLMTDGDVDGALTMIQKAYQGSPDNADFQILMMKVCTVALQTDFAKYSQRVREFEHLLAIGPERRLYLTAMIQGFRKQKRLDLAFEKLLELSDARFKSRPSILGGRETMELEKWYSVDEDRWISTQAHQIFENATESERSSIEQLLQPRLKRAQEVILPFRVEQLAHLMDLPATAALRLEMANEWIVAKEWRQAESMLAELIAHASESIATKAIDSLIEVYRQTDRRSSAALVAAFYKRPLEWPAGNSGFANRDEPVFRESSRLADPADLSLAGLRSEQWPRGEVKTIEPEGVGSRFLAGARPIPCEIRVHEGEALRDWTAVLTVPNRLTLMDPWGQETQTYMVSLGSNNTFETPPVIHAVHSCLLLELRNQLIALTTLDSQGMLWRQSFGAESIPSSANTSKLDEWGMEMVRPKADYSLQHVSSKGIVIHANNDLFVLDLMTGERLWSRTGFTGNLNVAADYPRLAVLQSDVAKRTILDIRDGSVIDVMRWENPVPVRTCFDKYAWSERKIFGKEASMKLWNAFDGQVVLERNFAEDTRATICNNRYMLALEPNGQVVYWDMIRGKEFVHRIEPTTHLTSVRAALHGDRIVVLPLSKLISIPGVNVTPITKRGEAISVAGNMIAMHPDDGRPAWSRSIRVEKFLYFPFQPRRSPALILARALDWQTAAGSKQQNTSFGVIDVRTGETVYRTDRLRSQGIDDFDARVSPHAKTVGFTFGGNAIQLQWTDAPTPPSPVINLGNTSVYELEAAGIPLKDIQATGGPNPQDLFEANPPRLRAR